MQVEFRYFSTMSGNRETIFADAAAFASEVGPERLIGITHSENIVTVWYWKQAEQPSSQS